MRFRLLLSLGLAAVVIMLGTSVAYASSPAQMLIEGLNWMEQHDVGATFDKNTVVSDPTMTAADSMTAGQIQNFLDGKPGVLKNTL